MFNIFKILTSSNIIDRYQDVKRCDLSNKKNDGCTLWFEGYNNMIPEEKKKKVILPVKIIEVTEKLGNQDCIWGGQEKSWKEERLKSSDKYL